MSNINPPPTKEAEEAEEAKEAEAMEELLLIITIPSIKNDDNYVLTHAHRIKIQHLVPGKRTPPLTSLKASLTPSRSLKSSSSSSSTAAGAEVGGSVQGLNKSTRSIDGFNNEDNRGYEGNEGNEDDTHRDDGRKRRKSLQEGPTMTIDDLLHLKGTYEMNLGTRLLFMEQNADIVGQSAKRLRFDLSDIGDAPTTN